MNPIEDNMEEILNELLPQASLYDPRKPLPQPSLGKCRNLLKVMQQTPHGVVCLLSALYYLGLTKVEPSVVWLAIDNKARRPARPNLPVRFVWFSGSALSEGKKILAVDGKEFEIYGIAKTIADCFKYRKRIGGFSQNGTAIAFAALEKALRTHNTDKDEVLHYAKICRVANVIQPFLDAIP